MAKAFLVQYKHMTDTAPDQMSLQNMEKKPSESFREYVHKWRDLAAQVQPPMMDVSTYLSGSGQYSRWMESPPIMLWRCDWTSKNLNPFNKS